MGHRAQSLKLSPISLTAALALGILLVVIGWSATRRGTVAQNPLVAENTVTDSGSTSYNNAPAMPALSLPHPPLSGESGGWDLSNFAPQVVGIVASQYAALQQNGAYTPEAGAAIADQMASALKAPLIYKTFSIGDITVVSDTSFARMQKYQADLRVALAPLSRNTTPEISIFSAYVQTKDPKYLDQLRTVAQEYATAASAASKVSVPQDALAQHLGILNAMEHFSATLKALADNTSDPITVVALLQTYNDAESDMVISFNSFASYVSNHPQT